MEVLERTDALVARDRALDAISTTDDFSTQRSLWRAALRYNARFKEERTAGDYGRPLLLRAWGAQGCGAQSDVTW